MSELYYGGDILTMEGDAPSYAEAVLVEEGRIRRVGSVSSLREEAPHARLHDLRGRAMLPAFLDSHSHLTQFAGTLRLVLLADCTSVGQIVEKLVEYLENRVKSCEEWIVGFSYDQNKLPEGKPPDRYDLDQISREHPVLICHASGHMGVVNSKALELLGITSDTPDPAGGRIGRIGDSREPNGYLEENAFIATQSQLPRPTLEELLRLLEEAQDIYFSYGITTAQDGMVNAPELGLLKAAADSGRLRMDVVAYVDYFQSGRLILENRELTKKYCGHLKLGGYKIFLDGSPQGRTAWMAEPYEQGDAGYTGYAVRTDKEVSEAVVASVKERVQLLAHCNGDAAAGQFLEALKQCDASEELRPVMIHAQLLRRNQLDAVKANHVIPSYFVAHTWYWGDVHLKNFGSARADYICPLKSTIEKRIPFTLHQDTPVIRPDMLETVWCAVNRVTREGKQLAESERITPYEALKGITVYAAYQYHEENRKGTIREGKAADFVILESDPVKADLKKLREIQVLETIKSGKTVYRKYK